MPPTMSGSPTAMVYTTRKADVGLGSPYEEGPAEPMFRDSVNGIMAGYAGLPLPACPLFQGRG